MFNDGFAPSHDLEVLGDSLRHLFLHFFASQPGDGPILFIARAIGFEWTTLAAARPVVVNGAAFLLSGKAIGELLARRTDVTVLFGIILKAFLAVRTAR